MIELVNSRNVEKLMEEYAEGATFQVPGLDAPIKGKDAIRAFHAGTFAAFPDWSMVVSKVIISGGETIVVNSVHGTHTGPLAGVDGQSFAPTNRSFIQDLLTRVVFDTDDKVQSLRAYGNSSDLNRQLGLPA
jgi:predicted ester cyclase